MKVTTFFLSRTKQNYTKPLNISLKKGNATLNVSLILLMSGVTFKQRLLHKNEDMQYFQNWK